MDIEKYYPNIISKPSARIIRNMWEESDLLMESIEYDEISLYLGKHLKMEDIIKEGIEDLVYKKEVKEKKKTVTKKVGKKHGHQQWWESRHSYCS